MKKLIFCFLCISFINSVLFSQTFEKVLNNDTDVKNKTLDLSDSLDDKNIKPDKKEETPNPQMAMANPDYLVTAGDIYSLSFVMETQPVTFSIAVDSSYKIRIANLGVINAAGLTFIQLKNQIDSLVSRNYPMAGMQFVLVSPSLFKVKITGEVLESKEVSTWALVRMSSILEEHLTEYSSLRTVEVISSNGTKKRYDLYKASRDGNFSNNPYLRPGDTINVNRIERKVSIDGAVERPGFYELLADENLKKLVEVYANGTLELADLTRASLIRIKDDKIAGTAYYLSKEDFDKDLELFCFDMVYIPSMSDYNCAMKIQGAVNVADINGENLEGVNKINVRIYEGTNYSTLIRNYNKSFSASSDLNKAYIIRYEIKVDKDGKLQEVEKHIPLDINKILFDSEFYCSETVKNGDVLIIPFKQFFVTVSGAVNLPGRFPYIPDRDWNYYVGLAGGINTFKNSRKTIEILTVEGKKLSKNNIIPPEANIEVKENSLIYKWSQVSGSVTTILTVVSTVLSIIVVTRSLNN